MPTCSQTFFAGRRIVHRGDVLDPNDPIIKGREGLFDNVAPQVSAPSASVVPAAAKAPAKKAAKRATKSTRKGTSSYSDATKKA